MRLGAAALTALLAEIGLACSRCRQIFSQSGMNNIALSCKRDQAMKEGKADLLFEPFYAA